MESTKIIGLTGGIGSGKSTIAGYLRSEGFDVYSSDLAARRIINSDEEVKKQIVALFGSEAYSDGILDRKFVGQRVFINSALLEQLNRIVHPRVFDDLRDFAYRSNNELVIVESAILFESGLAQLCNAVVCVVAPVEVRIERVLLRDGITREQAVERINNQMSDEDLSKRSSLVIINDKNAKISELGLEVSKFLRNFVG
ncbi:MAG: dephospho-CoA kinase [Paludibacteraceae bacterium]|nr:dephospho-CoA kinase [Paludibacteraceae bacterium]